MELKRKIVNGFEHLEIEPGPPTPDVKMVLNPLNGDGWRAIDVLEEVQAVLRKRGFALIHQPDSIKLAKVSGSPARATARIIAYVKEISEFGITWIDL
jgi:hypothetical protein